MSKERFGMAPIIGRQIFIIFLVSLLFLCSPAFAANRPILNTAECTAAVTLNGNPITDIYQDCVVTYTYSVSADSVPLTNVRVDALTNYPGDPLDPLNPPFRIHTVSFPNLAAGEKVSRSYSITITHDQLC
jgi:hypothetical protein